MIPTHRQNILKYGRIESVVFLKLRVISQRAGE
jgi:hypothetical protein